MNSLVQQTASTLREPDQSLIERVRRGDASGFEVLMRRYNQRLFRAARTILKNEAEAEDVLQEAYLRAFTHLDQFEGRALFSTWLTRIAVHEALARLRRNAVSPSPLREDAEPLLVSEVPGPEDQLLAKSLQTTLETEIERLAPLYRLVFVLREVEGLSTAETATCLSLTEENVKVRLHRAKHLLRARLRAWKPSLETVYGFLGDRCDHVVAAVLERLLHSD